jgi:DNA-directed RNA polymerase specialized sigma24 family protein
MRSDKALAAYEPFARYLTRKYPVIGLRGFDKDDLYQEAILAAWKALESFDPCCGYPQENWVKAKMRYRVIELVEVHGKARRATTLVALEEWGAVGGDTTVATVLARDELHRVADVIADLPISERRALAATVNGQRPEDMTPPMKESSVYTLTSVARRHVREALAA